MKYKEITPNWGLRDKSDRKKKIEDSKSYTDEKEYFDSAAEADQFIESASSNCYDFRVSHSIFRGICVSYKKKKV